MTRTKRNRGGQAGNQNARKHGFYSPALSPAETDQLWTIINVEGLDPRVALLRVKLLSSLQHNPGNRRVLAEASRLLAKAYSDICSLDAADRRYLKNVIELMLESILAQRSPAPPAQECERPVLTKRIPCTTVVRGFSLAPPPHTRKRAHQLREAHNHHTSQNESPVP